jgi:hypothetical protein
LTDGFATTVPETSGAIKRIQFLQRRNERRSLSLMYAPAVNLELPARKTTAARTRFCGDADDDRVDYPAKK